MKKEIHPAVLVGVLATVVGLIVFFGYRNLGGRQVDSAATMSPELKAKMNAAYGGGRGSSGSAPTR